MSKIITETFKKINFYLSGPNFFAIILNFILIMSFLIYKTLAFEKPSKDLDFEYFKSSINDEENNISRGKSLNFIYASKRGKNYYYFDCKANIKEENKIFFDSDEKAQKAGYTLSKSCK